MSSRPGLRHMVFFSAKDKADIDEIVDGLSILAGIPHARAFEVRRNSQSDEWSGEVDVVVYAEFACAEDMAAYKAHPLYAESIRRVRPLRELRIAADT